MSSAILYLAIIAIWACVLIPRWLKRDSARDLADPVAHSDVGAPDEDAADAELSDEADQPAPLSAPVSAPLNTDESHRRMLAARRRLLLMLIALEIASIVLAGLQLAALWVVLPPTIMLAGYLFLLREAAQADEERTEWQAAALARTREHERRRRVHAGRHAAPIQGAAEAATALAAKFAAAPVPEDHEDSGRDFAPGLAGKYTTSYADVGAAVRIGAGTDSGATDATDEDTYEPPRLRAVGD